MNTVVQGDCVDNLSKLDAGKVNLVFADPPFNIGYEYDVYDDTRGTNDYLDWSRKWIGGVHSCLAPNGSFWLAIGDEYAAELKLIAQNEIGFHCRSWVIWYYTFGVNCAKGFSRSHTHLFHFVKDPHDFVFNGDNPAVRIPSARQLVYADNRANPKGRLPDNTWIIRPQDAIHGFQPFTDSWYFARVAGTFKERRGFHGCQMPEQLLGRIIRVSSNPLDVVLDPFSGSGTTLAVAKKLGRQWIGFELSKDYVKNIKSRLQSIQPNDELDGPEDPIRSAPRTKPTGKLQMNDRPLPKANAETKSSIAKAFQKAGSGCSADVVLCDPDLNSRFVYECKSAKIPGSPFVWNRLMLRLRKAGKLPPATKKIRRMGFREMDAYTFASEIALHLMQIDYGMTLDDILCSPDAAQEFDAVASKFAPEFSSFEYRWAALSIRKRAKKLKGLAKLGSEKWGEIKRKPVKKLAFSNLDLSRFDESGVYILRGKSKLSPPIYVGESNNVRSRLDLAINSTAKSRWEMLGLDSVEFFPAKNDEQLGLQSAVVADTNPLLNTRLLVHAQ